MFHKIIIYLFKMPTTENSSYSDAYKDKRNMKTNQQSTINNKNTHKTTTV